MSVLAWVLLFCGTWPAWGAEPTVWGLEVDVASLAKVPLMGKVHILTRSLLRATLTETETGLVQQQQLCEVHVEDDVRISQTFIPQSFVRSMPPVTYPARIDPETGAYFADPGGYVVGYDASLSPDAVPKKKNDPAVIDSDHDGHPGATVILKVPLFGRVDLYIAQRGHQQFVGKLVDGKIRGEIVIIETLMNTLGASNRLFAMQSNSDVRPSFSGFRMEPIDVSWGCSQLIKGWVYEPSAWTEGGK